MNKVGFVTSLLHSSDAARGVGFYSKRLLDAMLPIAADKGIEIVENKIADCEIVHYPFFNLYFHTLPIFRSSKTVVTIHDVIPLEFPDHYPSGIKGRLNLTVQKIALKSVDAVVTDSQASVRAIQKYLAVPGKKINMIHLAADKKFKPLTNQKKLESVRRKYNLPTKFVLYVGDINWNKNIPGLVRACKKANLHLVMVGKAAIEIDKLGLYHAELVHLSEVDFSNVIRLGFLPDDELVAVYNLASIYCQPSFAEGFGLPVLEAMACGTPVACSNTHSLPEIAGDLATYFDPHDISDIAKALNSPKKDSKALVIHAAKFSWHNVAMRTLEIYQRLL